MLQDNEGKSVIDYLVDCRMLDRVSLNPDNAVRLLHSL